MRAYLAGANDAGSLALATQATLGGGLTNRLTISEAGVVNIVASLTLGTALAVAEGGTGLTSGYNNSN